MNPTTETRTEDLPPIMPFLDADVGDWVCVLFWRLTPGVGPAPNPNDGVWDYKWGRVVSRGAEFYCYEVPVTTAPHHGGDQPTERGSPLRFVSRTLAFRNDEDAKRFALTLPPPKPA